MQHQSVFQALTRSQTWVQYGAALLFGSVFLAISAKINIPFWPVPITMQSFAVIFLSALYGRNLAVATVAVYILEGLLGMPVFQGMKVGIAAFLFPTGGYIVGFLCAAFVVGSLVDRGWGKTPLSAVGIFVIGAAVLDIPGIAWLIRCVGTEQAIQCWISYQIPFLLKTGLGAALIPLVKNRQKQGS
jgi:biotin transport system substrate-specific component